MQKLKKLIEKQGIWNKMLSAVLVLTLIISGVHMPSVFAEETGANATGKDVTELIKESVKVTLMNGDKEITTDDELDREKPVNVSVAFSVPTKGDGITEDANMVKKGDTAKLLVLKKGLNISSSDDITIKTENGQYTLGTAKFVAGDKAVEDEKGKVYLEIKFDGDEAIFEKTEVTAVAKGAFKLDTSGLDPGQGGEVVVAVADREYKVKVKEPEEKLEITKKGEIDKTDRTVKWTVEVSSNKGILDDAVFTDELKDVGELVPESFVVEYKLKDKKRKSRR